MSGSSSSNIVPNEDYLRRRDEMHSRDKTKGGLTGWINRCLDDGSRSFTKSTLGKFADNDWPNIKEFVAQWESRRLLRIVKPIDEAAETDIVIEMLDYIDQKSNWPNWPVKSA